MAKYNENKSTNRKILIIDDQQIVHNAFKKILLQHQFEICSAYSGQEGFEIAKQAKENDRSYALAFVDMHMSGWDGLQTVSELWKITPGLQIVICSALVDYSWQKIVAKLGQTHHLLILKKPFDQAEILQLAYALTEKWNTEKELKNYKDYLENLVEQRTLKLEKSKQEAEQANYAKSEFLSSVSHEFKTPLNGILGYAQILQRNQNLTVENKKNIQVIEKNGERLLSLINKILHFSKIETKKLKLQFSYFSLPNLLEDISKTIDSWSQEKNLQFRCQQLSPIPDKVRGDEVSLQQVLINLLENAVKFTSQGSIILKFEYKKTSSQIYFHIEDRGIGIPEQQLDKIFQPFQQVKKEKGIGLGLSISKNLVELMGGKLEVKSTLGKGSLFKFAIQLPKALDSQMINHIKIKPDNDKTAQASCFAKPSVEDLKILENLAKMGDIIGILRQLEQIQQSGEFTAFVKEVQKFANEYDMMQIRQFIESCLS